MNSKINQLTIKCIFFKQDRQSDKMDRIVKIGIDNLFSNKIIKNSNQPLASTVVLCPLIPLDVRVLHRITDNYNTSYIQRGFTRNSVQYWIEQLCIISVLCRFFLHYVYMILFFFSFCFCLLMQFRHQKIHIQVHSEEKKHVCVPPTPPKNELNTNYFISSVKAILSHLTITF